MLNIDIFMNNIKAIQSDILDFLNDSCDQQEFFNNLINKFDQYSFTQEYKQFKNILYLINKISNNHHRVPLFFEKFEKILLHFKSDILQNFANSEIFHIFHDNKRILLFLFEEQILTMDESIYNLMKRESNYYEYFLPEINRFLYDPQAITNSINSKNDTFLQSRKIGENETILCELIRNDSIIEFIKYVNQKNLSLLTKIKPSIFETNPLLNKHNVTLIEYSAFFGSIQIFRYLINSKVKPEKSLWIYAIHGKNGEIIHFLEENKIIPNDPTYTKCVRESIKCHHIEISEYFLNSYLNELNEKSFSTSIKNYNFKYFPESLINDHYFYYLCESDNLLLIGYLLSTNKININFVDSDEYHFRVPPINAALKLDNFDIYNLLIKQNDLRIGDYCFSNINKIDKIIIPFSVPSIGIYAFSSCEFLKEVSMPSSVTSIEIGAFQNCISLAQINMPSSVTSIGISAFENCISLAQINMPSSVTYIGRSAFSRCESLSQIEIPSPVSCIRKCTFKDCTKLQKIEIHSNLTRIGSGAFSGCSLLQQINIPSSVTMIKNDAFNGCSSLTDISLPPLITAINESTFEGCSSLKKMTIPSKVKMIKSLSFIECLSLKEIFIPSSIQSIDDLAFYGCISLERINIYEINEIKETSKICQEIDSMNSTDGSLLDIFSIEMNDSSSLNLSKNEIYGFENYESLMENTIFSVNFIGKYAFYDCKSLKELVIPSSISLIEKYAFYKCTSLIDIKIPSSVTSIDKYAFKDCTSLKGISIPSFVTSIERGLFTNCYSLSKVTIPSSLNTIESFAFNNCTSLTEIVIPLSVENIKNCAFKNCSSLTLVNFNNSECNIAQNAFYQCKSLSNVVISGLIKIEYNSFPENTNVIQLF